MSVALQKGANISLSGAVPRLQVIVVGLRWDAKMCDGLPYELDAACFPLGEDGRVLDETDIVFSHNSSSRDGAVVHLGCDRAGQGDREQLAVDLHKLSGSTARLAFVVSIHNAEERDQDFSRLEGAAIRVLNGADGRELVRYTVAHEPSPFTAMVFGEVYRRGREWKFRAVGQGFIEGLRALADSYGVNIG